MLAGRLLLNLGKRERGTGSARSVRARAPSQGDHEASRHAAIVGRHGTALGPELRARAGRAGSMSIAAFAGRPEGCRVPARRLGCIRSRSQFSLRIPSATCSPSRRIRSPCRRTSRVFPRPPPSLRRSAARLPANPARPYPHCPRLEMSRSLHVLPAFRNLCCGDRLVGPSRARLVSQAGCVRRVIPTRCPCGSRPEAVPPRSSLGQPCHSRALAANERRSRSR